MKKLQIAAIATAFAIVSTAAMAQTPAKPSDTTTPAASGAANSHMSGSNGMKQDMKAKDAATTGAAAQDAKRGDTQTGKDMPQSKEPAGATKNAN
jgi:hypothetical protein